MNDYRWNALMYEARQFSRTFNRRMHVVAIHTEAGWQYHVTTELEALQAKELRRGRP